MISADSSGPPPAGSTLGVEEEFQLAEIQTYAPADRPQLGAAAACGVFGPRVHPELMTNQLETVSGVCATLAEVRAEIVGARAEARHAAAGVDAVLLAASTHPFGSWREQRVTASERYDSLVDHYGLLAVQQDICGCHVHVSVPDLDTAIAVMDRARPYLPVLLALTGSSPFHDSRDTGYESFRTPWWSRWPLTGPPDHFGSAAEYERAVGQLAATDAIVDASHIYWDVRPSSRYPTLEFRIADVCTRVDDVVLYAGLVRSLVRTLAGRHERGEPFEPPRADVVRTARWQAARDGLSGRLLDFRRGELVPSGVAVQALLAELRPDLEQHGEWVELRWLADQLLGRGTSAAGQRAVFHRTGSLRSVAEWVVEQGDVRLQSRTA